MLNFSTIKGNMKGKNRLKALKNIAIRKTYKVKLKLNEKTLVLFTQKIVIK